MKIYQPVAAETPLPPTPVPRGTVIAGVTSVTIVAGLGVLVLGGLIPVILTLLL